MPRVMTGVRICKILTLYCIRIFDESYNKFGMIFGRNIKGLSLSRWIATVPFVNLFSTFDTERAS